MKNLNEINFQNIKKVGIRVDFNVPTNDSFQITDNTRLLRAKDTIDFILKNECKILLLSHFGRLKELFDEKFSFINLIDQFSDVLGYEIQLLPYEEFLQNGLKQFNASIKIPAAISGLAARESAARALAVSISASGSTIWSSRPN